MIEQLFNRSKEKRQRLRGPMGKGKFGGRNGKKELGKLGGRNEGEIFSTRFSGSDFPALGLPVSAL